MKTKERQWSMIRRYQHVFISVRALWPHALRFTRELRLKVISNSLLMFDSLKMLMSINEH